MSKIDTIPVRLSKKQYEEISHIQERERQNSPLGIAPNTHEIARKLVSIALEHLKNEVQA
jgi:hypothetical protein